MQSNGRWKIVDGNQFMFDFDQNFVEAYAALDRIREYGFDQSCFVGRPDPSLTYLRRSDCAGVDFQSVKKENNEVVIGGTLAYSAVLSDDCGNTIRGVLEAAIEQGNVRFPAGTQKVACPAGESCRVSGTLETASTGRRLNGRLASQRLVPGTALVVFEYKVDGEVVAETAMKISIGAAPTIPAPLPRIPGLVPETSEPTPVVQVQETFVRGDPNSSGTVDMTDGLAILGRLFLGTELQCVSAADVDDNARIETEDALAIFGFLFFGKAPPQAPYPTCGVDTTRDALSCQTQVCD